MWRIAVYYYICRDRYYWTPIAISLNSIQEEEDTNRLNRVEPLSRSISSNKAAESGFLDDTSAPALYDKKGNGSGLKVSSIDVDNSEEPAFQLVESSAARRIDRHLSTSSNTYSNYVIGKVLAKDKISKYYMKKLPIVMEMCSDYKLTKSTSTKVKFTLAFFYCLRPAIFILILNSFPLSPIVPLIYSISTSIIYMMFIYINRRMYRYTLYLYLCISIEMQVTIVSILLVYLSSHPTPRSTVAIILPYVYCIFTTLDVVSIVYYIVMKIVDSCSNDHTNDYRLYRYVVYVLSGYSVNSDVRIERSMKYNDDNEVKGESRENMQMGTGSVEGFEVEKNQFERRISYKPPKPKVLSGGNKSSHTAKKIIPIESQSSSPKKNPIKSIMNRTVAGHTGSFISDTNPSNKQEGHGTTSINTHIDNNPSQHNNETTIKQKPTDHTMNRYARTLPVHPHRTDLQDLIEYSPKIESSKPVKSTLTEFEKQFYKEKSIRDMQERAKNSFSRDDMNSSIILYIENTGSFELNLQDDIKPDPFGGRFSKNKKEMNDGPRPPLQSNTFKFKSSSDSSQESSKKSINS